ncbi:hypothetical protein AB0I28_04970 [Phytomonospora sp. NPDC050363]|uniref:hypothetical protein n=1 Tax=Phytomonospora sp. NPDC050363 TaxID=3155642 RepID=UPI0033F1914B
MAPVTGSVSMDAADEALLIVPKGALPPPADWPEPLEKAELGEGAAPRVGTVWTVGIGGAVDRETVSDAAEVPTVGPPGVPVAVPEVSSGLSVERWTAGAGLPSMSGSAAPSPPGLSPREVAEAESLATDAGVRGRSPMSCAVTDGVSGLSTTGELSTGDGSDHSTPTPGASVPSEVGGGWVAPGVEVGSEKDAEENSGVVGEEKAEADDAPLGEPGLEPNGEVPVPVTTGRPSEAEAGDEVVGELRGVLAGEVARRWTAGVAGEEVPVDALELSAPSAGVSGRGEEPRVGASGAADGLGEGCGADGG